MIGKNLDWAFQLQDDWLIVSVILQPFGKQKAAIFFRIKKTFLLVHALEKAGTAQNRL